MASGGGADIQIILVSTSQQGSLLTYFANNVQFYNVFSRGPDSCQTQVTQAIHRRVDGLELPDPRHAPLPHLEPLLWPGPGPPGGAPQHLLHNVGVTHCLEKLISDVQVLVSCSLHGCRPRGVLQHQVSARLRELPAPGQHVHTRAQQGGARPVKRVIFVK